jgi:hypothetical protein
MAGTAVAGVIAVTAVAGRRAEKVGLRGGSPGPSDIRRGLAWTLWASAVITLSTGPDWASIVTAIGTVLVAIVAVGIALWSEWRDRQAPCG